MKHGLYADGASDKVREAMEAAQGVEGLEPELVLLRSRLAAWLTGNDDLDGDQIESLSRILLRIESLVKSIQQMALIAEAGKPEGVQIIIGAMGGIIQEYVPQPKWKEALAHLKRLVIAEEE
jgi:predicted TIM-barrel fold metal-dependent hydrolase